MLLAGEVTATTFLAAELCDVISLMLLPGKCTPDQIVVLPVRPLSVAEMTSQVGSQAVAVTSSGKSMVAAA